MIGALLLYTITNEDLSKEFTAALTRQQWIHEPDQSTYYYPYSLTEIDLANFQQWIDAFFKEDDRKHVEFIDLYYPYKDILQPLEIRKIHFFRK